MGNRLNAFEVNVNGTVLDYRVGAALDLAGVRRYFRQRHTVVSLRNGGRHVLGILRKDGREYFLKLATTEGISAVTKNEYRWNQEYNALFGNDSLYRVPENVEEGEYGNLYYLVCGMLAGIPLTAGPGAALVTDAERHIPDIIAFSERIRSMTDSGDAGGFRATFADKTEAWYRAIPEAIRSRYGVSGLLDLVESGTGSLSAGARHGDFAPWHIISLPDGGLGLIDGEHYLKNGVEGYDVCYLMQRLYAVSGERRFARSLYDRLIAGGYRAASLRTVLAARAIGGYLDASLNPGSGYEAAADFHAWVLQSGF